ncbi:MAG: AAA family ATPase [Acidobacteriota bacterium]|nr:AAA family ATPase [Acidobacteriota bacterium]
MTRAEWLEANHHALSVEIANLRAHLLRRLGEEVDEPQERVPGDVPFAIDVVTRAFLLSPFERRVLLLCAAIELEPSFATLCARLNDDASQPFPTFRLALAALPDAHWSALSPQSSLRRWRLIEMSNALMLTGAALRIDERILHFLTGLNEPDERLGAYIDAIAPSPLAPSHESIAARFVAMWTAASNGEQELAPVQLIASDGATRRAIVAAACAHLGLTAHLATARPLPVNTTDVETLIRLYERESWLTGCALLIDCENFDPHDAARAEALRQIADRMRVPLVIGSAEPQRIGTRVTMTIDVPRPEHAEHRALWLGALGDTAATLDGALDRVIAQFAIAPSSMPAIAASVRDARDPANALWEACRLSARRRMDDLAQRIDANAEWDELVLPDAQKQLLRDLVTAVRFRTRVYGDWGFAAKDARGQGVTALFAGVSGSGKTMAAEVIARELALDLYRIDLSAVVSKYIGETEKNLRRVFEAAEESGAILLFDEADALFGRRSEVKDSHDRYANIEVSYLLQRMEAYRGVAILTTNLRDSIDPAFLRRLRFVVQFPFPGAEQRLEIWRRIFPVAVPRMDVDIEKLARLPIAGGNIRNIAVQAAFGAARDRTPVTMLHLLEATRTEYAKLEKNLSGADTEGWT